MEIRKSGKTSVYDSLEIKCPYCFESFYHNDVMFRTKAIPKSKIEEWKAKKGKYELQNTPEAIATVAELNKKIAMGNRYEAKKDERLIEYWEKNGWKESSGLYEIGDGYCEYRDVSDEDAVEIGKITDPVIDGSDIIKAEYDSENFLIAATDKRGERTETRVCPHCHNKLPKLYGKNPIKFLAVIGVSGAGKTVMLSKLLEKMGSLVDKVGLASTNAKRYTADRYVTKYKIEQNKAMPEGTNKAQFKPPIFVNLVGSSAGQRDSVTLAIYDIAGENCVNPDKINQIAPFVKNASGIIMLLDPEQVDGWEILDSSSEAVAADLGVESVINTLANAFLCDNNQKSNVPLAVTFSKSDLLKFAKVSGRSIVGENSNIFKNIEYKCRKFMLDAFKNIDGEVRMLLREHCRPFYNSIPTYFNKSGFFAISTLGHNTESETDGTGKTQKVIKRNIEHTRLEEPLLWLLYQWGVIDGFSERPVKLTVKERLKKMFGGR